MKNLIFLSLGVLSFAGSAIASGDRQRSLMRDFIGIDGHTVSFKPDLYRPVCGLCEGLSPR